MLGILNIEATSGSSSLPEVFISKSVQSLAYAVFKLSLSLKMLHVCFPAFPRQQLPLEYRQEFHGPLKCSGLILGLDF